MMKQIFLAICAFLFVSLVAEDKSFVVVICSYNNENYYHANLSSVYHQSYPHYRVIYTDDHSSDGTYDGVSRFIEEQQWQDKVTLIRNQRRQQAMENIYNAVQLCDSKEIVVLLDGDDWFFHEDVLQRLNEFYQNPNTWMTYGSYIYHPSNTRGECSQKVPYYVAETNTMRYYVQTGDNWKLSHLKSFYAGLFKQIKKEHFMWEGQFLQSTSDQAIMIPLFELSGNHAVYIDEILYVNNRDNPLNDDKVNKSEQNSCMLYVWSLPIYSPLTELPE